MIESDSMTIGSLFSGIGGLELGLERAGLGPVLWQVEQDEFCQRLLEKHWPTTERFKDIRNVTSTNLAPVDVICGGFPCQDVSKPTGRGLSGPKSGLWIEYCRIVASLKPCFCVVENVAGNASRWIDVVREDLEQLSYETIPVQLEAHDFGAPHARSRLFVVAYSHRGALREWAKRQSSRPPQRIREREKGKSRHVGTHGGWPSHVEVCRETDGFSGQLDLDRHRVLGNAVVPECAEVIGYLISELETK